MDLVAEFTAITTADADTARFYLEAAGGDLEAAVGNYFAGGGAERPPAAAAAPPAAAAPNPLAEAAAARAARAGAAGGASGSGAGGAAPRSSRPAAAAAPGNVRGLGDLGGEDEDSEDDDVNDYYVGGEKSGQVVRGAPKDRSGDEVEELFEGARRAGAEEGRVEDLAPPGQSSGPFRGSARTLAGGEAAPPQQQQQRPPGPEVRALTITFFRNQMFTVGDGPPRAVHDPANQPFLEAIMRGQLPAELDPQDPNVELKVNLVRRDEDYTEPAKPKYTAFGGAGHKLSSDASTSAAAAAPPPPAAAAAPGPVAWEGADISLPVTSIQLRLADGSRMVAEFNLTHTVGDIRRFIRASRPDMAPSYHLATAFPPKQLDDDSATIEAAGLANSVVVQKP